MLPTPFHDDTNTIVLFLVPLKLEGLRALTALTGLLIPLNFHHSQFSYWYNNTLANALDSILFSEF